MTTTLFIIVADATAASPDLGAQVARRFSKDPDCQAMPNVWAIRTGSSPDDVLAFIQQQRLVDPAAPVIVVPVEERWAAINAKRVPDCWKDSGGWRVISVSGAEGALPEPYEVS